MARHLVVRLKRTDHTFPLRAVSTIARLRRLMAERLSQTILVAPELVVLRCGSQPLDDFMNVSELDYDAPPHVRATLRPHAVLSLVFGILELRVALDAAARCDAICRFLCGRLFLPASAIRLAQNGRPLTDELIGALSTELPVEFSVDSYIVLAVVCGARAANYALPANDTVRDLVSLIQVRHGDLELPLGDLKLFRQQRLLADNEELSRFQSKTITCEVSQEWDEANQLGIEVRIKKRKHLFVYPAMATLAYVRSEIGRRYGVLWDRISMGKQLSKRLFEIQDSPNPLKITCEEVSVTVTMDNRGEIPRAFDKPEKTITIQVPLLSQVIDLRTVYAEMANLPVFNVVLSSPTGQRLDDEERLAVFVIRRQIALFAHWNANGKNRLYIGDRILDFPVGLRFHEILNGSKRRCAIELNGKLVPRASEIGSIVGHPQNPMAVVWEPSLLTVHFREETFFAEVADGMQVGELSDCVTVSESCRFLCGGKVLDNRAQMLEANPDLLPVDVRIVKEGAGKPYFFQCGKQVFSVRWRTPPTVNVARCRIAQLNKVGSVNLWINDMKCDDNDVLDSGIEYLVKVG
jgi:hypothetical protein